MVVRYVRIVCAFILLALLSLIGWNTFAIAQQPAPALDQHNDLREPLIVPERNEGPQLRSPMKAPLEVFVSCYVFGGPSEFEIVTTSPQGAALLPEQKEAVEAYMKNCRRKIKKLWHPPCCLNARSTNVAIHVAADGAIYKLRFDRSSGYAECDRSAMDAIENCAPFPALPAGIDQLSLLFKFNHNPAPPSPADPDSYVAELKKRLQHNWWPPTHCEGVAVSFILLADGTMQDNVVTQSTGHAICDECGLEAVRRSYAFPPLPKPFRQAKVSVRFPAIARSSYDTLVDVQVDWTK